MVLGGYMNGRDNGEFSPIWSTWFVDRLFIVDELARSEREKAERERSERGAFETPGTDCDQADRTRTHAGKSHRKN